MMGCMFFMAILLALCGVLFLFIGIVAPRGKFLGLNYQQLPGINTPTTTASLGAWQAAHRTVARINILISLYYFLGLGAVWISGVKASEFLFMAILMIGLLAFVPVILVANRAAQTYLDNEDR